MSEAVGFDTSRFDALGSTRLESARPAQGAFGYGQWEILERIARGGSLAELLLSIVALVEHQAENMLCTILIFDPATNQLRHGAALRFSPGLCTYIDGLHIGPDVGSCGAAAFHQRPVIVTDIATHPSWEPFRARFLDEGLRACWSTPILSPARELLGTLAMYFVEPRGPSDEERAWADAATHLAAIALTRARAERENDRLLRTLEQRVKELTLLHRSTRLLQSPELPIARQLAELVEMIPNGWRFPDLCRARIAWGDVEVHTPGFAETTWKQVAHAPAGARSVRLEVVYLREVPPTPEGPFAAEERALLESLADVIGAHLEKHHAEEERARLEGQLRQGQRIQALGTLAGGIAHDFNNILTAISGHTHLGLNDIEEERSPLDSLLAIQEASTRAVELVRRILMFSRYQQPELELCSIVPIIEESVQLLRGSVPPGVRVELELPAEQPLVFADPGQLHTIVVNLGANAAYAIGESGTIRVALDSIPSTDEELASSADRRFDRYARLSVSDTGLGMDDATVQRIFEPFFTTKPTGQGNGLGLSVVHGIVKGHEGCIAVHSQPGRGSVFRIYLPQSRDAPARPALSSRPSRPSVARPTGSAPRVMYVDDEEPLVVLAMRWLRRLGYEVTGFSDSTQALEAFRARPLDFDVLISDVSMPGLSGLDLVREVRALRKDVVVVVSSGYLRHEDHQRAKELGAVDVVVKPQSMAEFGRILHRILSERRGENPAQALPANGEAADPVS